HVESATHFTATAANESLAPPLAAIVVKRGQPNQAGDFATVQLSQLRQMSHQHARPLGSDARNTLQQLVFLARQGRVGNELARLSVYVLNLFVQPSQMDLEIMANRFFTSSSQAIRFRSSDLNQLSLPTHQFLHGLLLLTRQGSRRRLDRFGKPRQ